jgi:diguanylate cyclase (GGDEF)-like protein
LDDDERGLSRQPPVAGGQQPLARLAFGRYEADFRDRTARLATTLFVGAAVVVLVTVTFLPDQIDRTPFVIAAGVALVTAPTFPFLPWRRLPPWMLLSLAVLGFVLLTVAGRLSEGGLIHYLPLYSLSFVYIGLVARPWVPVCFVPLGILSFALGDPNGLSDHVVDLATAAPVWALIGEVLAQAMEERREGEARRTAALAQAADTDALTGLGNRRLFDRQLASVKPGDAVVIVDLDHFKKVNDEHGHPVGDAALRNIAEAMRRIVRSGDCVARYGGEEFTLVLAGAGIPGAEATLARLRSLWEAIDGITTFSAGIAVDYGRSGPETLSRADAALYEAKRKGRNRVEVG